ncbi:unnamed protein product, partial [Prorocentrum cordatum]
AGPLLDVLVDLPAAAADAHLARTAEDAAADVREWVTKFLDSTNRETDNFVAAAATLPDAALLNLTSRFLDDTSHRLKMLQKHTLLVALRVKKARAHRPERGMALDLDLSHVGASEDDSSSSSALTP